MSSKLIISKTRLTQSLQVELEIQDRCFKQYSCTAADCPATSCDPICKAKLQNQNKINNISRKIKELDQQIEIAQQKEENRRKQKELKIQISKVRIKAGEHKIKRLQEKLAKLNDRNIQSNISIDMNSEDFSKAFDSLRERKESKFAQVFETDTKEMKITVWKTWFGMEGSKQKCLICNTRDISISNFCCGRVKPSFNNSVENMRPICLACRDQMSGLIMKDFITYYYPHSLAIK